MSHLYLLAPICALAIFLQCATARGDNSNFKEEAVPWLLNEVPNILKSQDKSTGRFGTQPWIVTDQNAIYPLAVAWSLDRPDNKYLHNPELLEAVILAGDALIADMDKTGQWEFRKKDNSTWGPIFMPWTYSRWIRAFGIIKDAMPAEKRAAWEKAITLGVEGIIKTELTKPPHNIPAHHAMGVYRAGQIFDRADWRDVASAYLKDKVIPSQDKDGGFWSEHVGPVVAYNFVYVDALGCYYGMSRDESVLPALRKASLYHANFTYPDGSAVETVDERNPYHAGASIPNVGFTFSPEGRGYAKQQWSRRNVPLSADVAASYILYAEDGPIVMPGAGASEGAPSRYVMGKNDAMTVRQGPWFACISAYRADISDKRWIQDRQNFVSIFHEKTGIFLGGGNTKLQPLWSTFTVGDVKLLSHKPGTTNPAFIPPTGIQHTPLATKLDPDAMSLTLSFANNVNCSVRLEFPDSTSARLTYSLLDKSDLPVEAHVTLMHAMKQPWSTAAGRSRTLSEEPLRLTGVEIGEWFEHQGARVSVPKDATLTWPVLPHNPYTRDGHAEPEQGRLVITLPLGREPSQRTINVTVP